MNATLCSKNTRNAFGYVSLSLCMLITNYDLQKSIKEKKIDVLIEEATKQTEHEKKNLWCLVQILIDVKYDMIYSRKGNDQLLVDLMANFKL